jgi:ABC-type anion transport system duplicated permease subunit
VRAGEAGVGGGADLTAGNVARAGWLEAVVLMLKIGWTRSVTRRLYEEGHRDRVCLCRRAAGT